jgi:hypothetical protein
VPIVATRPVHRKPVGVPAAAVNSASASRATLEPAVPSAPSQVVPDDSIA